MTQPAAHNFMTEICLADFCQESSQKYVAFPFYDDKKPLLEPSPLCALSLRAAGSMRFRWNASNPARDDFLASLRDSRVFGAAKAGESKSFVPVQLSHSRTVYDVLCAEDTAGKIGDGIITVNPSLVPTVTVADCVPLFLWEPRTGVFGIVHSGWKGTGIVADALALAAERYGANASDFFIAIGPHIRECCYCVDEERADYFARNFSSDCVTPLDDAQSPKIRWNTGGGRAFRLSLERANLALLKKIGVQERRITLCTDCTCCNPVFGSNRRETIATGCQDNFTVMAAFIIKPS